MKKGLVLLLLIIYGLSSLGATLNFQYCCGKLEKVNFIPVKAKACCKAAMKKKMEENGCCNDKTFDLKIKGDQAPVPAYTFNPLQAQAIVSTQSIYAVSISCNVEKHRPEVFAPPPLQNNGLAFFCSFRI